MPVDAIRDTRDQLEAMMDDWRSLTPEQREIRKRFARYSRGWDEHEAGAPCNPPADWSDQDRKFYRNGWEAARDSFQERAFGPLEELQEIVEEGTG